LGLKERSLVIEPINVPGKRALVLAGLTSKLKVRSKENPTLNRLVQKVAETEITKLYPRALHSTGF